MLKLLSIIPRLISLLLLAFLIWFGFVFYKQFSALEEEGVSRVAAAEQAFAHTADITKNIFNSLYGGNIKKGFSFLSNKFTKEIDAKEQFIASRGVPEVYIKIISYDVLGENGFHQKRKTPLYLDIWFYGEPHNKKVVFENGYFKEEKTIKNTDDYIVNPLNPLDINNNITANKLLKIMGDADCIIKGEDSSLVTYRFQEKEGRPLLSATFTDDKLIFLSSGIIFLSEGEEKICK